MGNRSTNNLTLVIQIQVQIRGNHIAAIFAHITIAQRWVYIQIFRSDTFFKIQTKWYHIYIGFKNAREKLLVKWSPELPHASSVTKIGKPQVLLTYWSYVLHGAATVIQKTVSGFLLFRGLNYSGKSMLKSMLVNKNFIIWHLIGWQRSWRRIKSQASIINKNFQTGILIGWQHSRQSTTLHA